MLWMSKHAALSKHGRLGTLTLRVLLPSRRSRALSGFLAVVHLIFARRLAEPRAVPFPLRPQHCLPVLLPRV